MAAITRWVQYSPDAVGVAGDGDNDCKGTRGYSIGTASVSDTFTIGSNSNRLHLSIGGESAPYITLYSGSNLDPRFVAKDITEKLHNISGKTSKKWKNAICRWKNAYTDAAGYDDYGNRFKIYSGETGSASSVVVTSGTYDSGPVLGFNTKEEQGGLAGTYVFDGTATISGTYKGFLDETYKVVISNDNDATRGIGVPTKGGGNSYDGTFTTGGAFSGGVDITYVISIDVTNGSTMGGGTGNVPTMSWTSTGTDDSTVATELLYANHWYNVGAYGLMVKVSDAVFNTVDPAWTIVCYKPDYAQGSNASAAVGLAQYVWASDRGDMSDTPTTTVSGSPTRLGSRGLYIQFNPDSPSDNLGAGDTFYVMCSAPKPLGYNISTLNYGNVTVSTESDVKSIMFEVESGAVEVSTVKFGLNSHGTFDHHNQGNADTYFRFGTVGPKNTAGTTPEDGIEWQPNVAATDIDSDTPPAYLYATEDNLAVVSTADDSEAVGATGLMSDPMWVNIRLGSSETGANSAILQRLFFDYS